jgi:aryl-alcohol dehydrogenase-like predicted oxidoreductase
LQEYANDVVYHIKQVCDESLRRLKLDQIPLYQQHRPDPKVPYEETIGALVELKDEGKIRHVGLSNVDEGHLRADTDAGQLLFEIHGVILALHHDARFLRHAGAEERARVAFERLLAHASTPQGSSSSPDSL